MWFVLWNCCIRSVSFVVDEGITKLLFVTDFVRW